METANCLHVTVNFPSRYRCGLLNHLSLVDNNAIHYYTYWYNDNNVFN